jgi:hypothetical protein
VILPETGAAGAERVAESVRLAIANLKLAASCIAGCPVPDGQRGRRDSNAGMA